MLKRLVLAAALVAISPAFAQFNPGCGVGFCLRGGAGVSPPSGVTGRSMMNLSVSGSAPAFLNIWKATQPVFNSGATPPDMRLDANFNPTEAFTGTLTMGIASSSLIWPGEYWIHADQGVTTTITATGATGCANVTGITFTGGCATITINTSGGSALASFVPTSSGFAHPGTGTYAAPSPSTATFAIIRKFGANDATTPGTDLYNYLTYRSNPYDARGIFTPEFLAYISSTGVSTLRPMGDVNAGTSGNSNLDAQWRYRATMTQTTWGQGFVRYPPGAWNGGFGAAGTISYSAVAGAGCTATGGSNELYTATFTDDLPTPGAGPFANGTLVQGIIGTTNATTAPKLCFGTGAYPIYMINTGVPPAAGTILVGMGSFIFDPVLNAGAGGFWYSTGNGSIGGGLVNYLPFEAQIALANYTNKHYQQTIPIMADDDYVQQLATMAYNNLSSGLQYMPEYGNEVAWNGSFWASKYANQRGIELGFTGGASGQSYYALRVRQIMGDIMPPIWNGRRSGLARVWAYQGASGSALGSNTTNLNRLQCVDCAPTGVSTGRGNAVYVAYTEAFCTFVGSSCAGGANYTAFPNRTVDFILHAQFAPYLGGTNLFFGGDIFQGATPTSANFQFYQDLVTAWEAGNTATTRAMIDADVRGGRIFVQNVTCSGSTWTTAGAHNFPSNIANVAFEVTGGTSYGNLVNNAMYRATSTGANTFTIQAFSAGIPSGSAITCGTAATGTVTVGWMGGNSNNANFQTLKALNSNWMRFGQALVAQFNGARPAAWPNETANIIYSQYEGAIEIQGPTQTQCNTLGVVSSSPTYQFTGDTVNASNITNIQAIGPDTFDSLYTKLMTGMTVSGTNLAASNVLGNINFDYALSSVSPTPTGSATGVTITATGNCATSIALAIADYKRSALMQALQYDYFNQFLGADSSMPSYQQMPNAALPSQLVAGGTGLNANSPVSNLYGLQIGALWGDSPTFKTMDGIQQFNAN